MGRPRPAFPLPRLSLPLAELDHYYDAVIVGSGYGGGIAAARLAAAGKTVCVLERGAELHPGDYPSDLHSAWHAVQLHVGGELSHGSPKGLFDLRFGNGIGVLVGCGLGGTSLINANVCLEAEPWVLRDSAWPAELRSDVDGGLRAGIARAKEMLMGPPDVDSRAPEKLQKLVMLAREAEALGGGFSRPPLAVTQASRWNAAGIHQPGCAECGDCMSGCNYGAKNTVLMNYLPYARKHGAEIFTEMRVESVERDDRSSDWIVRFRCVSSAADRFAAPPRFVRAGLVVLAAGTLGSTEILLRSAAKLPLSRRVGTRFSGNGDVLHFAYDCGEPVNGIGLGEERLDAHDPVGPCIAGVIDLRPGNGERGFVIEDGSPPGAIAKVMPLFLGMMAVLETSGRAAIFGAAREFWHWLITLPAKPYDGAMLRTQTHLVMSHDRAAGRLTLEDGKLAIDYAGVGNEPIFRDVDQILARVTETIGGSPISNPIWDKFWSRLPRRLWNWAVHRYRRKGRGNRDLISVHPLGGCPMAEDAAAGVVNARQQVFSGPAGADVHETLYVMDGSVVPRALGVNPLLTISGLAERACEILLRDRFGLALVTPSAEDMRRKAWPERRGPATLGFRFTERLAGWVASDCESRRGLSHEEERCRYHADAERGRAQDPERNAISLVLDMEIADYEAFMADPLHEIQVSGTVELPSHFGAPAMVVKDSYARIFTASEERVNTRTMVYRVNAVTEDGRRFRVEGEKWVHDRLLPLRAWYEPTRLFTRVYEESTGREVAGGVACVGVIDFFKLNLSQRAVNASGWVESWALRLRFVVWFTLQLLAHWNPVFAPAERVRRDAKE